MTEPRLLEKIVIATMKLLPCILALFVAVYLKRTVTYKPQTYFKKYWKTLHLLSFAIAVFEMLF